MSGNELDIFAEDCRQAGKAIRKAMTDTTRDTAKDGMRAMTNFARESAGSHGRRYPSAITMERLGLYEFVYGPDASLPQGGMSFETGSRNQKPHLDGARSADLIEAVYEGRVDRAIGKAIAETIR